MPAPYLPRFDRLAQVTFGQAAVGLAPFAGAEANGVALVTGFIYASPWNFCADQPVTGWTVCASAPVTSWSAGYSAPVTTWNFVSGG